MKILKLNVLTTPSLKSLAQTIFSRNHLNVGEVFIEDINSELLSEMLCDPQSVYYTNQHNINIIFLNLSDWMSQSQALYLKPAAQIIDLALQSSKRTQLPRGFEIAHLHPYETNYLFNEIFEQQTYLKNGISIKENMFVVDIGANIGMFSLFIKNICHTAKIYAFEPMPEVYQVLQVNMNAYQIGQAIPMAIADVDDSKFFTYYPKSTVFSSRYAKLEEDETRIKKIITNTLTRKIEGIELEKLTDYIDSLLINRLESRKERVITQKLSTFINQQGISSIDLLKIDAEGSEWDILNSLMPSDWNKIQQIVLEVHPNSTNSVEHICRLLEQYSFETKQHQENLLDDTGFINIYAKKHYKGQYTITTELDYYIRNNISVLVDALSYYAQHNSNPLLIFDYQEPNRFFASSDTLEKQINYLNCVNILYSRQVMPEFIDKPAKLSILSEICHVIDGMVPR